MIYSRIVREDFPKRNKDLKNGAGGSHIIRQCRSIPSLGRVRAKPRGRNTHTVKEGGRGRMACQCDVQRGGLVGLALQALQGACILLENSEQNSDKI